LWHGGIGEACVSLQVLNLILIKKLLLFFGSKCLYISVVGESDLASLKLIGAEEIPIVNGDEPLHFGELSKEGRDQNRSWKST